MARLLASLVSARSIGFRMVVLVTVLAAGLTVAIGNAQSPQGVFHTGATAGIIRDVAKVGSTIYATGTWLNPCADHDNNPSTACIVRIDGALWTFAGANAPTRTALPDLSTGGANLAAGDAITPDAQFIATQVRASSGPTAARVTTTTNPMTILNLTPTTTFPTSTYAGGGRLARAISDNGSVLYGQVNKFLGLAGAQSRVLRFDVSGTTVTATELYSQPATVSYNGTNYATRQVIIPRGASGDGSVAIFSTFSDVPFPDNRAFRYVDGTGSTAVSLLPGGTINAPGALTDDGKIVALVGTSTRFPNREVYLADYSTGTERITALGSPNEPWGVGAAGISGDGSVVTATSSIGGCTPVPCRYGYFHNSNGWFQLTTAMAAAGMDLSGWKAFQVAGTSADGTMVWGSGFHNGAEEGYVAEFPADFLKNFDVIPTAPTDTSIVGVWSADGTGNPSTSNPSSVVAFMRDGTYYEIEPSGFERGSFQFDGSSLRAVTRLDMNGDGGLSEINGTTEPLSVIGNELRSPAGCTWDPNNPDACFVARRITSTPGQLDGSWVLGDPTKADSSAVIVFTSSRKYFMAQDGDPVADPGGRDGIEIGQGAWDPVTKIISVTTIATDTNGQWGLSHATGPITAVLSADELQLLAGDDTGKQTLTRVVDPASVVPSITSALAAGANLGSPFSYTVTASYGLTFGASGLPAGLSINSATGAITGAPMQLGDFNVSISATNTFGDSGSATLALSVVSTVPTPTGSGVSVQPALPPGTDPITLTFSNVTSAGDTTIELIDTTTAPPPPSGFQLGPVYYEVSTTASFSGPVTLCFSYAGVTGTPRLFHYDNGAWVDITTSVDPATQTICGTTTSFSPFAIFVSPITRTGFYAPVSPVAGFINTVKGGSTVPLKFNVYVNGVEKTDTSGLQFTVASMSCTSTAEDPVDFITTGATSLRYDALARQFVQNWQTPRGSGCYIVRMTTTVDGLSIGALFKTK